ncbi:MAG: hypothetical protein ACTSXQ_06205 [Alphaproteobacteria bacterium]
MTRINLKFQNNAADYLMQVAGRQVPFALALALTRTAQEAQKDVKRHIENRFVIRRKSGGFGSSIRIKPATKTNLEARVHSMAGFAALQQTGGKKGARDGRLAIPAYDDIKNVKRRTSKNSPAGYLADGAFIIRLRSGQQAIAQRHKGRSLRILYFLRNKADVKKRLDMIETAQRTVGIEFSVMFNKTLREVIVKG